MIIKIYDLFYFTYTILSSKFNPLSLKSDPISVTDPILTCKINEPSLSLLINNTFNLSVSIVDKKSLNSINNISWIVRLIYIINIQN